MNLIVEKKPNHKTDREATKSLDKEGRSIRGEEPVLCSQQSWSKEHSEGWNAQSRSKIRSPFCNSRKWENEVGAGASSVLSKSQKQKRYSKIRTQLDKVNLQEAIFIQPYTSYLSIGWLERKWFQKFKFITLVYNKNFFQPVLEPYILQHIKFLQINPKETRFQGHQYHF